MLPEPETQTADFFRLQKIALANFVRLHPGVPANVRPELVSMLESQYEAIVKTFTITVDAAHRMEAGRQTAIAAKAADRKRKKPAKPLATTRLPTLHGPADYSASALIEGRR